jgi:hypothetical protein
MSSTESRSGFRLPWSSDRSHESQPADAQVETEIEHAPEGSGSVVWPDSDYHARIGVTPTQPRPHDGSADEPSSDAAGQPSPEAATQEPAMLDTTPVTPAPVAPKKPSKLMADLSAAIRATAQAARDEALAKVDADVTSVVAEIRASSKLGEASLKQASDDEIVQIREWSKAEIARIKEETEGRIEARKTLLGEEVAAHAEQIERRVGGVEALAASYRDDLVSYTDRLVREDDPSRLATMAESMPEPPDFGDAEPAAAAHVAPVDPIAEDVAEPVAGAVVEAEAVAEAAWAEPTPASDTDEATSLAVATAIADEPAAELAVEVEPEPVVEVEPVFEAEPEPVAEVEPVFEAEPEPVAEVEPVFEAEPEPDVEPRPVTGTAWGAGSPWASDDEFRPRAAASGGTDVPRWDAGDAPEGFPEAGEGGDPVDRGAIMAALEAAAEAVVAAEAAAESADQAEAAADVAETAAELVVGRTGGSDEPDPEAQAAFSARVDAGGFDTESFTDRLANLMPGHESAAGDGSVRTTQVIVSGLVSVASIASFKRHLGRLGGVEGVGVASGPDGEFVFNVTHRADVSFRDAVPTMPGFAARVTSTGDGVVTVSARDPEAEG